MALATLAGWPTPLSAQAAPGAVIRGVVYDSLAGRPLAGATVQLVDPADPVAFGRTARSDPRGRFELTGVPDGRYVAGFLHPLLDSLGISAPLAEVYVTRGQAADLALAIPSSPRLHAAICRGATSGAVLVGTVRDSRDHGPVNGAVVTARWREYTLRTGGADQQAKSAEVRTGPDGWFRLCGVPSAGTVVLNAIRGRDSTDAVEVDVAPASFHRRDLYVGEAAALTVAGSGRPDSAGGVAPRVIHVGPGRLSGRVVAAEGGRPVAGARVGIVGGPETTANARGEWSLEGVPTGTRTIQARGLGFYPVFRPVDVVAGAAPVELSLSTLRSLMDTVRVTASRLRLEGTGFEQRSRTGMGRYITPEEMARLPVSLTSQLFARVAGVRLDRGTLGETYLTVRGPFGRCAPSVYIDGHHIRGLSAEDIDSWAHPDDVAGIEVYTGAMVPPEFQPGMMGCGSIVIWTRPFDNPATRWSLVRRVAQGGAAILLSVGVGALMW